MCAKSIKSLLLVRVPRIILLVQTLSQCLNLKIVLGNSNRAWQPKVIVLSSFKREIQQLVLKFRPQTNGFDLLRIGENSDGGYLVPNDLENIEACFSVGSDKVMHFESHLEQSFGIKSYILDKEDKIPENLTSFQIFRNGFLGTETNLDTITLEDWLIETGVSSSGDLILQMDIEGDEYPTLLQTSSEIIKRFRILVIEFHGLNFFVDYNDFKNLYSPVLRKLLDDFDIVHFHPNNRCGVWNLQDFKFPRVVEITFHRKDRRSKSLENCVTPNPMDQKNIPSNPEIVVDWDSMSIHNDLNR